ncbi:efflux RND transporter periplasmic adaptor subunit [Leptospira idonii]|uniref:HlyD family efflux transporter periplasmic adaptor subunit n=1 Tax=Leptospira idonii TaxID=1193500 RepID=A0A4R9LVT5_9LEPT|nr:HlyD family efflux transporter periplasmic adaptor subunit [Leptospira idonii]TGN17304.1 HlyD family efflux transporter periplasmic adaptor subunit [Leptospira idonii]
MNKKWILAATALLVLLSGGYYYFFAGSKKEKFVYQQLNVKRGNLNVFVRATGSVQPKNRLEIKPPIAGRIESVLVEEGNVVSKGKMLAWMSSTERAALLDAARAKGANELKEWEDLYKPTPVLAPLRGLVIANNIRPGQTVTQQDILYVLSDSLIVQAKVDETDLSRIKKGQKAMLTIDSFPGEAIRGEVSHIAYEAVTENNVTVYTVDINPLSHPEFLRSGMSSTVDFIFAEEKDVLVVPNESVFQENGKNFVWVKKGKDSEKYVPQEVTLGISDDSYTHLKSGLEEGEVFYLKKQIQKQKPAANSGGPFSTPRIPRR